jgi:hypothetical protein
MLIVGDAEHQLQVAKFRSAFNGTFVNTELLHTSAQAQSIAEHASQLHPRLGAGSIETHGFFVGDDVEAACVSITERVKLVLDAYGWTEPSKESTFVWNTRLLRTQGAHFHHDAHNPSWHKSLFWVYVLQADDTDLRFPNLDLNVTLEPGQLIVFDPLQPHGLVKQGATEFVSRKFTRNHRQLFLSGDMAYPHAFWESIGVERRTAQLQSSKFRDLNDIMVMDCSGEILNKNYA